MADKKVRIVVTGKDDASKAMKSVNQSLLSVVKSAALVAIAFKVMKKATEVVVDFAKESGELAARNETMATSLQVVGENAGWEASQLEKAVQAVKEMGITTGVATTTVTRYIQSQLDAGKTTGEATDRMVELASAARDLAVVAGTNTSEALQTMQQAISGVLPRSLRVFGITENLNSVFERFAKTLGKTGDELSELERKQAVEWRILEEGVRVAGAYDEAMGSVGKQTASLVRLTEEAKAEIGAGLLPVMSEGVKIQTAFWKIMVDLAPAIGDVLVPLGEWAKEVGPEIIEWMGSAAEILQTQILPAMRDFLVVLLQGREGQRQLADEAGEAAASYQEYTDAVILAARATGQIPDRVSDAAAATFLMKQGLLDTNEAWAANRVEVAQNTSELERLMNMTSIVGPAVEAMATTVGEAWDVAFNADKVQDAVAKMTDIISQHQTDLADMQIEFGDKRVKAQFDFDVKQLLGRAKFQAEMAQLQAAGDTEGMAKLQANYDESQALGVWNNDVQLQLAERGELEQVVVEKRKHLAMLTAQFDAVKISLKTETLAALAKGDIQRTAASKMLGLLGISLTAALKTEQAFQVASSDVWQKWATDVQLAASIGVDSMAAVLAAWDQDIAAAETALAAAQAELAGFTLDLPELVLPELLGDLGEGADKAKKAAQAVISDMTTSMADAIADAKQMMEDLVGFELPEGWELGLDKYKTAMLAVSKKFAEIWRQSQEQLEDAAEAAPGLAAIAGAFGKLVDATNKMKDFSEEAFEDAGGFEAATLGYIDRMEFVGRAMMDYIRQIKPQHRKMLADATDVAEDIKKLFSILGPDLTKIVPVRSAFKFKTDTTLYFSQMRDVGKKIMQWTGEIKPAWRIALADAAPVSENIKKLFGILGTDLTKLKAPEKGFMATFTNFLLNIEKATDVAVEILGRIKAKWGDQLATAAETMKNAAAIWRGVADITKAIDEAAELGGPDIAAANAMAGMINAILFGAPGQQGGAAGGLPGMGGGDIVVNFPRIIFDIPGFGTFVSGKISERISRLEEDMRDLRITFSAGSV